MRPVGENHHNWKGGRSKHTEGYVQILNRYHSRADNRGYVFEHILIVEEIMGKSLPKGACVHHIDGNGTNNIPKNLVICENDSYHKLLHQRQKAFKLTGDANKRKCKYCKNYDSLKNLEVSKVSGVYHRQCNMDYCCRRRSK